MAAQKIINIVLVSGRLGLPADECQQQPFVITAALRLDGGSERLAVECTVLILDLNHINLTTRNHQANKRQVIGAQALHSLVQPLGEVCLTVQGDTHCKDISTALTLA